MKIYLGAYYQSRLAVPDTTSAHMRIAQLARRYPHMLESFHYMSPKMVDAIRANNNHTVFLDSGAFSAFTQGTTIDINEYAKFIREHPDIVAVASNLDVIGRDASAAAATYENQKKLEALGVKVCPVHHVRDDDYWLEKYLGEGYPYIFLGGMVPETIPTLRLWLRHVWRRYLLNEDGTARVKVHGFGLTNLELMFRHPWHSVDSTSWAMTAQYGGVLIDFPRPSGRVRTVKVDFSNKSGKRYDVNSWHFNSLIKPLRNVVVARLEQLEAERSKEPEVEAQLEEETGYKQGFNPVALAESYGWRDYFNIEFFRRAMSR